MARYEMRQKVWAIGDDFVIRDDAGNEAFHVKSKVWSFGNKLRFEDASGTELAHIRQKLAAWGTVYEIERDGALAATVKKKQLTLRPHFDVELASGNPLEVDGNFSEHEYAITSNGAPVATVSMRWFSMTDTYGIDVADGEDDVLVLAICVVIDMVNHPDEQ